MMPRTSRVQRKTQETDIDLSLSLDGTGTCRAETGIGFFDHMLDALSRHAGFDLTVVCRGDLEVDAHHTVEDVGICLGRAVAEALGEKTGITRFGLGFVPMDESLARAVIDLSGRPFLVYQADVTEERIGAFPSSLAREFFRAVSDHGRLNLHIDLLRGSNAHHAVEAVFKAVARALRQAVALDPSVRGVPSTKGVL
jgi:imidazoleglycerol-phosphate dehydratase